MEEKEGGWRGSVEIEGGCGGGEGGWRWRRGRVEVEEREGGDGKSFIVLVCQINTLIL